jgi:endonuclease/exonuclease/phosphatase family metal-dependent hydrolase
MRIISWNLHGAAVPGRASNEKQLRAWNYMRELGADLILAQEVSGSAIPSWAIEEWNFVAGEHGRFRKVWNWGSVIAAKHELGLVPYHESLADPWLAQLYDLVLVGQIRLGIGAMLVASVHTIAYPARKWVREYATSIKLSESELEGLRRPNSREVPFVNDFAFTALERMIGDRRFVVAGDWNTCRKFAGGPEFFVRVKSSGWVECHEEPEEQSYFRKGTGGYQLDHAFVDAGTGASGMRCQIHSNELVRALSDHAPMVIDIKSWTSA